MNPKPLTFSTVVLCALGLSTTAQAVPYVLKTYTIPGKFNVSATGINDAGDLIGTYSDELFGRAHGFLLHNGTVTFLDSPEANFVLPSGINNHGQIVGTAQGIGGFLRDPDGTLTQISFPTPPQLSPSTSGASDINDHAQIVGTWVQSRTKITDVGPKPFNAYVYHDGTFSEPVPVPDPPALAALTGYHINDLGWVLALRRSPIRNDPQIRVLITPEGINDVSDLLSRELVQDINDVGRALMVRQPIIEPCPYLAEIDAHGRISNRNPLELSLPPGISCTDLNATAINNLGEIAGVVHDLSGAGQSRAFIFSPQEVAVSEPASLTLLGLGLLPLFAGRRRK